VIAVTQLPSSYHRDDKQPAIGRPAERISPRDAHIGLWHMQMGRELLALRRYDEAIQEGLKTTDSWYRSVLSYTALAAFYAAADKMAAMFPTCLCGT
jgi:hypothetical protein